MLTADQTLARFEGLRRAQTNGRYAPHKPLLVLLALARIQRGEARLEAAHIQWHTAGGPDVEANGLSLCALHHKLFDPGAFTLEPEGLRVVFSRHAIAGSKGLEGELRHHGQPLLLPQSPDLLPGTQFIDWNHHNVFKTPARV